jgi:hypothetical protein
VSRITPQSLRTLQRFYEAKQVQKSGGILYGPDSSRWPARWFDTVALLEAEIAREEYAGKRAIAAHIASRT